MSLSFIKTYDGLREIFELYTERSNDGFWVWDLERADYEYYSPRFKEILGYADEEFPNVPESWQKTIHPEDLELAIYNFEEHMKDPSHKYYQIVRYFHKKGHIVWVICRGYSIRNDDGTPKCMIGIHTDITQLKSIENELKIARDESVIASKSKDLFLASMSHEIRTPMNGIIGLLQLLQQTDLTPDQTDIVKDLVMSATSLSTLLGDILNFSKMGNDKISLHPVNFNIKKTLKSLYKSSITTIGDKQIVTRLKIIKGVPSRLYGDKDRIGQIFSNVLSNAMKYTNKGAVFVKMSSKTKGDVCRVILTVQDTGVGISEENLDKIFDPYFRVDSSVGVPGTGLGLNVCYHLCKVMEGNIKCKSKLGEGTTFRVEIPLIIPVKKESATTNKTKSRSKYKGLKVAVAEDNYINQKVISGYLDMLGITNVDFAGNGEEIVEMIRNDQSYDLILMDDKMPKMTGIEASKCIKRFNKKIPIVAMTANAMYYDRKRYLKYMDEYISKPINLDELERIIGTYDTSGT